MTISSSNKSRMDEEVWGHLKEMGGTMTPTKIGTGTVWDFNGRGVTIPDPHNGTYPEEVIQDIIRTIKIATGTYVGYPARVF